MSRELVLACAALAFVFGAGCQAGQGDAANEGSAPASSSSATSVVPMEVMNRTFLVRPEDEDWIEEIRLSEVGDRFLLHVRPQLRTPAEGPWILTLARDGNPAVYRIPGLRVDRATGHLTFLVHKASMEAGDYLILLTLEEGGMTTTDERQAFRFRVI